MDLVHVIIIVGRFITATDTLILYDVTMDSLRQGPPAEVCIMYHENCEARVDCDRVCPHGYPPPPAPPAE